MSDRKPTDPDDPDLLGELEFVGSAPQHSGVEGASPAAPDPSVPKQPPTLDAAPELEIELEGDTETEGDAELGETTAGHPAGSPAAVSKLQHARAARLAAQALDSDAYRALWRDVLLSPLRRGVLLGYFVLVVLMAGACWIEGGETQDARMVNSLLQAGAFLLSIGVLGIYARRIVVCTYPVERRVPWLRDREDGASWWGAISGFIAIVVMLCLPLIVFLTYDAIAETPTWIRWIFTVVLAALAAAQLPLALVAVVVRDNILAALPTTVIRLWRREPRASRIAAGTSMAFAGLFVLSMVVSSVFNSGSVDRVLTAAQDHELWKDALRVLNFAVRVVAVHLALVSFRVAGLLVRDVPEVEEVLT